MTDTVFPEGGDRITEDVLTDQNAQTFRTGYVKEGFNLQNAGGGTVDVTAGQAFVRYDTDSKESFVGRDETTTVSVSSGATEDVYLSIDISANGDAIDIRAGSARYNASLKLGSVDDSAGTVTEVNRDPDVTVSDVVADTSSFGSVSADRAGIDGLQVRPPATMAKGYDSHALPTYQNWSRYSANPVLEAADFNSPVDNFLADPCSIRIGDALYCYIEGASTSSSTKIVGAKITLDDPSQPTFSVTPRNGGDYLVSSNSHMSFFNPVRSGDTLYAVSQGGRGSNQTDLWKTSITNGEPDDGSWGHVRTIVSGSGSSDDPLANLKDPALTYRDGYWTLLISSSYPNSTHNKLGVWFIDDLESGSPIQPDWSPLDLSPSKIELSPMVHQATDSLLVYDQGFKLRRIADLSPVGASLDADATTTFEPQNGTWEEGGHHITYDRLGPYYVGTIDGQNTSGDGEYRIGVLYWEVGR